MKLVSRGDTTVVDAYLSPILRGYVNQVAGELGDVPLLFMQSNGGLAEAQRFAGKDAILSGPAGGIVGAARSAERAGFGQIIAFDMGGTSTDVSHYAGEFERNAETTIAGVKLRAPMLAINTVAAGGGSICRFDGARYRVGPESAGCRSWPRLLPPRRTAHDHRLQSDAGQAPARAFSRDLRALRRPAARPGCRRVEIRGAGRRNRGGNRRSAQPAAGRRRLRRDRQRHDGECDQADLDRARLRCHGIHALLFRRRRRPACLRRRRCARHRAHLHPPAGRRAVGLWHWRRRPAGDQRARRRAAAFARPHAGTRTRRWTTSRKKARRRWPTRVSSDRASPRCAART